MIKISQEDILVLLQKEKKPLSRREIAEKLDFNPDKVSESLRKMLEHKEIKFVEIDREKAKNRFKDKVPTRRLRLYFT